VVRIWWFVLVVSGLVDCAHLFCARGLQLSSMMYSCRTLHGGRQGRCRALIGWSGRAVRVRAAEAACVEGLRQRIVLDCLSQQHAHLCSNVQVNNFALRQQAVLVEQCGELCHCETCT
jgi:hypothetical protein